MVGGRDVVRVLNCSSFHDTHLVCSGDLSYLGGSWTKTIGSAGEVPLQGDFSAEHMIFGVQGIDPIRQEKLIDLLDIDLQWRMHKVSDGQRHRVQIYEVTVDLDVVARMDLLEFFEEECEQATGLAYIHDGELKRSKKLSEVVELKKSSNLLSVVRVMAPF